MRNTLLLGSFTAAVFLAAALLFTVEPMVAKMLLPVLGGSPSVWTGCMLFYQAALLAGYALAHGLGRLARPVQTAALVVLLVLAALTLPVSMRGASPPSGDGTMLWMLARLVAVIGGPFLVVSAVAPLMQRWFALTEHPAAHDPYFLYASSNMGSLGGLLAYPLVLEPLLPLTGGEGRAFLSSQSGLWTLGYVALIAVVAVCAVGVFRGRAPERSDAKRWSEDRPEGSPMRWVVYAFLPSSVMLGATQYLANDLVSAPFVWVLPLALYLLSFVATFARRPWIPVERSSVLLAVTGIAVVASVWAFIRPTAWMLPLHPLTVLAVGLVCHGRLAAERPPAERLTAFYLWVALGGALGGVFNALLAPLLFNDVFEYPLALVLACFARPATRKRGGIGLDLALPALVALAAWGIFWGLGKTGTDQPLVVALLAVGVPCVLVLVLMRRTVAFALGLGVLFATAWLQVQRPNETLEQSRTFFGVHRVVERDSDPFSSTLSDGSERIFVIPQRILYHGTTRHGLQLLDPALRDLPGSYYHSSGPLGQLFGLLEDDPRRDRVAVIGLGAGTLAAYGRIGQRYDFFEIDPEVVRIARDSDWFTWVKGSDARTTFVVGDGRRSLSKTEDGTYGLVVIDAFSSDAIPMHMLTREAVQMYFRKLRPDGLLVMNLTNQYLDLGPVAEALTHDLGLAALMRSDSVETPEQKLEGKYRSTWAVIAREPSHLGALNETYQWIELPLAGDDLHRGRFLWTDDYANPLAVLRTGL